MKPFLLLLLLPASASAQTTYLKSDLKAQEKAYAIIGTENTSRLKTPGGQYTDLTKFKGKKVVADLWYGNCGPCFVQIPFLEKIKEIFRSDTGLVFINVCTETEDSLWRMRIKEKGITGEHLLDERKRRYRSDKLLINELKMEGWPTYVFIDENGKLQGATYVKPESFILFAYYVDGLLKGRSLKTSAENFRQEIHAAEFSPAFNSFLSEKIMLAGETAKAMVARYKPFFK